MHSNGFNFKPTFPALSTLAADHLIRRADGAVCLGGIHYLWDLVTVTLSSLTLLPRGAAPPSQSGRQVPRHLLFTNGK